MTVPLLFTKLHIPPLRPGLVPRPRLIERLNAELLTRDAFSRALTLISSPAGFGKTTLLSEWISHSWSSTSDLGVPSPDEEPIQSPKSKIQNRVAWLSLDEGDNDPVLFLHYLIAALQQIDGAVGQGARSLLKSPQLPPGQGVAAQLLNDLSTIPDPFILVLDDYHAIRRAEIDEMLAFLIDNQPPRMHTVIATRRDPRLPLARWRARGELAEIRMPDLRFTVEEVRDLMNQRMGLDLPAELVAALEARTEGWITGLQLAGLALQGVAYLDDSPDPADFVRQFSGSDRYVIDYLVEEVLQRQPPHLRRFLQQTAVLEELCVPLCDHVRFGGADPGAGRQDSASILREVEQANLFLIPLDSRREWYRYHHLFADVLATALDTEEAQALHRRAASWYEVHGPLSKAIRHALAGRDLATAARLIRVAAPDQLQHAAFVRVLSWLDALPDEVVRSDAELATHKGYILLWRGDAEAAGSYADAAEASLPREAPAVTRGQVLTLRAHLCTERPEVIPLATEAIELLDETTPFFYGAALLLLAAGYKSRGDVMAMMEAFRRLERLERERNPFLAATAIAEMADALRLQGKRREALLLCQRAMERYTDSRGRPLPGLVVVLLVSAVLAYEANELALAQQLAGQTATLAQQTGMPFLAAQARCYVEVPCRWALGDGPAAWAALQAARELIADDHPLYPEANLDTGACEVGLHLKEGKIPAAARWAATFDLPPEIRQYELSHVYLTYVRVLLARDRLQEAAGALKRLEAWARAGGWQRVLLSTAILRAVAAYKNGDEAAALDYLARAVHLAAEEDYRRAFLDEDPVIFEMLPRLRARQDRTVDSLFVDRLLADFADERVRASKHAAEDEGEPGPVPLAAQPLIDPLTEREMEVLELLAEGLSTPEIAARLYISAGTAKWHTINIYRKLDVHSRLQAVTRARELGLI